MKIAILALSKGAKKLGQTLATTLDADFIAPETSIASSMKNLWPHYDAFIMIMATGIVVRTIAPLIKDKHADPCVVVMDELGHFSITLLSGHLGGGNALAKRVAHATGGQAVITTASDTLSLTPIDLWAKNRQMVLDSRSFTKISSKLVNTGQITVFSEIGGNDLPDDFIQVAQPTCADLIISNRVKQWPQEATILRPRDLVIGIGCNRNTLTAEIREAVFNTCQENKLSLLSVNKLASIDLKADEKGLIAFAQELEKEIVFFSSDKLNSIQNVSYSEAVYTATGAKGVCEPAAILAAKTGKLLVRKVKCKNVTVAIAQIQPEPTANYT